VLARYAEPSNAPDFGSATFPRETRRAVPSVSPASKRRRYLIATALIAIGGIIGAALAAGPKPSSAPAAVQETASGTPVAPAESATRAEPEPAVEPRATARPPQVSAAAATTTARPTSRARAPAALPRTSKPPAPPEPPNVLDTFP
jgi:hypothetical protein